MTQHDWKNQTAENFENKKKIKKNLKKKKFENSKNTYIVFSYSTHLKKLKLHFGFFPEGGRGGTVLDVGFGDFTKIYLKS